MPRKAKNAKNIRSDRATCPKCGRVFKLQLACPNCQRAVTPADLVGNDYLLFKYDVRIRQRTQLLRRMPLELAGAWVGRSRERRRIMLTARELPADFEFPPLPAFLRRPPKIPTQRQE